MFKKPNSGKRTNMPQLGLLDNDDGSMDLSDDDLDLEAELAALSGNRGQHKPRRPAPLPPSDLNTMIAESLKDVPSEDEGSGDDDDPELLNELMELGIADAPLAAPPDAPPPPLADDSTVSVLQDRITNYTAAENDAKQKGEISRARRFGRGLKNLNDLLKQAKAGKPIKIEDIPPPVMIRKEPSTPVAPSEPENDRTEAEPEPPIAPEPVGPPPPLPVDTPELSPERQQGLDMILKRQDEFKSAALTAKHSGDKTMAIEYMKVVKQFDIVVDAYRKGQEMDLNELPTPDSIAEMVRSQQKEENQVETSSEPVPEPPQPQSLITASTLAEGLQQRLAAFQELEAKARAEGNESKARRMARIVKQYKDVARAHAAGGRVNTDVLPAPPGHGPLPGEGASVPPSPAAPRAAPAAPTPPVAPKLGTKYEKQLALLLHRQKQFKDAAIAAKKDGDIEQAKEYLRAAKGFDPVIQAARGGLVVDLKTLPLPPKQSEQLEHTFDVITSEDCGPPQADDISLSDTDVLSRLMAQLTTQLKLCLTNGEHYRAMGNVAETNRFTNLAVAVKQDLDVVTLAKSLGQNPPSFHYETKEFQVVQCNTDLNETDLELTIVRGIAYNVPNPREIDTYVRFEFPYPQEAPVSDRTVTVKDTASPVYNAVFPLTISRKARPCQRVFKRHGIKLEVYSKGGWFSRDTLLGTATVKLAALETQVTIHDSFPLMDGRRAAGGALEVRLRVRTPLLQPQVDRSVNRWLHIDN